MQIRILIALLRLLMTLFLQRRPLPHWTKKSNFALFAEVVVLKLTYSSFFFLSLYR